MSAKGLNDLEEVRPFMYVSLRRHSMGAQVWLVLSLKADVECNSMESHHYAQGIAGSARESTKGNMSFCQGPSTLHTQQNSPWECILLAVYYFGFLAVDRPDEPARCMLHYSFMMLRRSFLALWSTFAKPCL